MSKHIPSFLVLTLGLGLGACDQPDPAEPVVQRSFAQGTVRATVDDDGEVVAEVRAHDGQPLATMDFDLPQAEGVLVVEGRDEVHELSFDASEPLDVDGVCEVAYRLTTGDYSEPGDTQFRVQQIGCDGFSGPGCCFAGAGGYFCEVCWGSNGYYDTYCGPAVY